MKSFIIGIIGILFSATVTFAAGCTEKFSWLPNPEDDIAGYNINYGQANGGPYPNSVHIDYISTVDGRIHGEVTGLTCEEHYFFVVTAVNDYGVEGAFSNQVQVGLTASSTLAGKTSHLPAIFALLLKKENS